MFFLAIETELELSAQELKKALRVGIQDMLQERNLNVDISIHLESLQQGE
jgi:hypothetical protein